ncbi:MAG TPA: hypothetical protein VMZ31_00370 [Phycisphaerae bacterium]|nr:hypothetical protein [Phycisphaerae bacterium]
MARNTLSILGVCIGIVVTMATCGCTWQSDTRLGVGIADESAPAWAKGSGVQDIPGQTCFVGRGVAYSVMDERGAVNAAREDVLQQLGRLISTRVQMVSVEGDVRENAETGFPPGGPCPLDSVLVGSDKSGVRFLPSDELQQVIARAAAMFTSGLAGDLVDQEVYFEKWSAIQESRGLLGSRHRGMIRYKCWLLASIPQDKLERRIEEFRTFVQEAYGRYVEDRRRAIAWMEQDRTLRIQREEDARTWTRQDQLGDREEARELRDFAVRGPAFRVSATH